MDLPSKAYYGVKCPKCPAVFWCATKDRIELLCTVSFKDRGLPYIEENMGIVVGFGNFEHTCRPDLNE